jgi:predicted ribosomally synthesized peptide with SipW-like signal peptide
MDGAGCTTPQVFNWVVGSVHSVSAPATIAGAGMQGTFSAWSDSGAATHSITVGAAGGTYTTTYTMRYLLTTAVSGPGTVTYLAKVTGWSARPPGRRGSPATASKRSPAHAR